MNALPNFPCTWQPVTPAQAPRLMAVTVKLPDAAPVRYERRYASSMDAYDEALRRYAACTGITVEPIDAVPNAPAEVQP